jgi:hypothetical protein
MGMFEEMNACSGLAKAITGPAVEVGPEGQERRYRGWGEAAYAYLCRYAKEHPSGFTTELVRAWAASEGLEDDSPSAWGAVVRRAKKNGVIEFAGYEQSSNASRHLNMVRIWRAKK